MAHTVNEFGSDVTAVLKGSDLIVLRADTRAKRERQAPRLLPRNPRLTPAISARVQKQLSSQSLLPARSAVRSSRAWSGCAAGPPR